MLKRILLIGWIISSIFLLLYSFTQVDLSLTLSQISLWQVIQRFFQEIGYFNRPLSVVLFLIIAFIMFVLYVLTLYQIKKENFPRKYVFGVVFALSGILFFSYNAFSYDLFNYIFDAKIFTFYFQNPYFHKALDFTEDPMLSFMRWTHRLYPYGPVWLFITIPLSFIGHNIFLLTFYIFKFLSAIAFVSSAFLIEKIARKIQVNSLFAVAVFCLNPLVIIESLVSSHNDIVMVAFALFSVLLLLERRVIKSAFWLFISVGIKFATIFMIPAFLAKKFLNIDNNKFFIFLSASMLLAVILASLRTNFQPWYLLFVLPFSAFISEKKYIFTPTLVISIAAVFYYSPYIYLGNWDPPVPQFLNSLMIGSIVLSLVLVSIIKSFKRT